MLPMMCGPMMAPRACEGQIGEEGQALGLGQDLTDRLPALVPQIDRPEDAKLVHGGKTPPGAPRDARITVKSRIRGVGITVW